MCRSTSTRNGGRWATGGGEGTWRAGPSLTPTPAGRSGESATVELPGRKYRGKQKGKCRHFINFLVCGGLATLSSSFCISFCTSRNSALGERGQRQRCFHLWANPLNIYQTLTLGREILSCSVTPLNENDDIFLVLYLHIYSMSSWLGQIFRM